VPPQAANASSSTCDAPFQISYGNRKISRTYDLLLDKKFQSVATADGRLSLPLFPGPHVLLVHLNDVPYKVPAQKQYAVDFAFDCARPAMSVEIGPAAKPL